MKNNIKNIQHNLSKNISYLYELLRNEEYPQCIYLEFEHDGTPVNLLKEKLQGYFLNQTLDSIDTDPLKHLEAEFDEQESRFRSLCAFRRISSIELTDDTIIIGYSFLTSVERVENALKLLKEKKNKEFLSLYPEITEISTYFETDSLMIILAHLDAQISLKSEE
ncbi:MAG: hypothetical protein P4L35_06255 [Ignavibacteriaceae bacterium]|nr:hypothetical protein [Ignavibacteriaceae bacterium]